MPPMDGESQSCHWAWEEDDALKALRKLPTRFTNQQGFTLVEVTIILLVLVLLNSIMLPQLGNFNRLARFVVVKEDTAAICATLKKFLDEVMVRGPFEQPGGGTVTPVNPIGLLVGPGAPPSNSGALAAGNCADANNWSDPLAANAAAAGTVTCTPDTPGTGTAVIFRVDDMRFHLQINDPFNDDSVTASYRYKNQTETTSIGAFFGWRGPYFNEINADPWGTRYEVNTFGLHSDGDGIGFSDAVICVSFGPNTIAETNFSMPHPDNFVIGGDDIAAVLSAMGPF